jgi:hypothetical protein
MPHSWSSLSRKLVASLHRRRKTTEAEREDIQQVPDMPQTLDKVPRPHNERSFRIPRKPLPPSAFKHVHLTTRTYAVVRTPPSPVCAIDYRPSAIIHNQPVAGFELGAPLISLEEAQRKQREGLLSGEAGPARVTTSKNESTSTHHKEDLLRRTAPGTSGTGKPPRSRMDWGRLTLPRHQGDAVGLGGRGRPIDEDELLPEKKISPLNYSAHAVHTHRTAKSQRAESTAIVLGLCTFNMRLC